MCRSNERKLSAAQSLSSELSAVDILISFYQSYLIFLKHDWLLCLNIQFIWRGARVRHHDLLTLLLVYLHFLSFVIILIIEI